MSKIEVDKVDPQSGTALEIGTSGDTVTVPSGVGLTLTDSTLLLPTTIQTDKLDPKSGTALEIGSSGDTITIPSGATITNSGTATGFGLTEADQWRLNANQALTTLDTTTLLSGVWERNDTAGYSQIGTGMSESSGVWTFPSTGIYLIDLGFIFYSASGGSEYNTVDIWSTLNDSAYTNQSYSNIAAQASSIDYNASTGSFIFDVTDTAQCKLKLQYYIQGNVTLVGSSVANVTYVNFIRLGDT